MSAAFCALILGCGAGPSPDAPNDPVAAVLLNGDGQVQFPGTSLFELPRIQLVDAAGTATPVSAWPVQWTVLAGEGSVNPAVTTTSVRGTAVTQWIMGIDPGENRLRADVEGLGTIEFTARAVLPGPIVFVSGREGFVGSEFEGYAGSLYVMNEDGSNVLPLFPPGTPVEVHSRPRWHPDGQRIAFARLMIRPAGGVPGLLRLGIYQLTLDRLPVTQLPIGGLPAFVQFLAEPAWHHLGDRLVARLDQAAGPGAQQLFDVGADGRVPVEITSTVREAHSPDWSPVDDRIVFGCVQNQLRRICTMNDDGTGLFVLTNDGVEDRDPAWSPDGQEILFARDPANGGGVWLMDASGTNLRQVMDGRASGPAWSPDGAQFLVTVETGDRQDIHLVDIATGNAANLTDSPFRDRDPHWRW